MLGFRKLFRCPYCAKGQGLIVVDRDAALGRVGSTTEPVLVHVDQGDPERVVIFNPDGPSGRPCEHLIALLLDVEVIEPLQPNGNVNDGFHTLVCYTASYDHPWLRDDSNEFYATFLWDEVNGGDEPAYHPTTSYRIRRPFHQRVLRAAGKVIRISGTVMVAMEPKVFFRQLVEGADRCDQDSESGCGIQKE